MTAICVIIPTIGRSTLADLLDSISPQMQAGDRVMVAYDAPDRFDFCQESVDIARKESEDGVTWRCYPPSHVAGGHYGHVARNRMLDLLADLEDAPEWVWSIDDDDCATFGAVDMIRSAIESEQAPWYVFRMRGGESSHFAGLVVPLMGQTLQRGNVGTPMIVFPVGGARFGVGEFDGHAAGYFGDYEMALALDAELGDPAWMEPTVAVIRPVAVGA